MAEKKRGSAKAQIEEKAELLAAPIAEEHGCRIYDVEYVRQAGEYSLCVYIDKDGGVNIGDCEAVSRQISDALDEDDFIPDAYTLVVSSPGLGRKLTKDRHLAQSVGQAVDIKGYHELEGGSREVSGILRSFDKETIVISLEDKELEIPRKEIAQIRLQLDF